MRLESEPISDVIIPLRSSDPQEGRADAQALEFTPDDWEVAQTVTVTGINDGEEDGAKGYAIVLERVQSRDRFYDGFDPDDVSLTNRDNDPEPDSPLPDDPGPPGEKAGLGGPWMRNCCGRTGAKYAWERGRLTCFLSLPFCSSRFPGRVLLKKR